MKILISNGEYPDRRLWLDLPIANDPSLIKTTSTLTTLAATGQIEIKLEITDIESHVPNLKKYILEDGGEANISEMNLLAQKISHMGGINLGKFSGALDIEPVFGIEDIQRIADNLDDYELFPDVTTDKELGIYLVESGDVEIPQDMLKYVDFSRIGAEYYSNHSCAYGDNCLVVKKDCVGLNQVTKLKDLLATPLENNTYLVNAEFDDGWIPVGGLCVSALPGEFKEEWADILEAPVSSINHGGAYGREIHLTGVDSKRLQDFPFAILPFCEMDGQNASEEIMGMGGMCQ